MIPDHHLAKAYAIVDKMAIGEIIELSRIPEEKRELFTDCIKHRAHYQRDIEFSNDYTKIKKICKI